MSNTYRFVGDRDFYHKGETLDAGDEIELSDTAYRIHEAYFEPVDDGDGDDEEDAGEDTDGAAGDETAPPFDPSEKTINDLEAALSESDYSAAGLEALLAAEKDGKDRDGARDAITDHLADEA